MNEDFGFSLHRRGTHRLAGRTVLQIVSSLDSDLDRASIDVASALAEAGARPLVAAPAGRLVSELQAKGGVWLDFPSQAKNPIAMMRNVKRLKSMLDREQVDLVHARSRPSGWVAYSATRSRKTPLVTSLHQISPGQSIIRQRYNSVMAKGDIVIAGSKFAAATIFGLYPFAAGHIVLVRPGVDFRSFSAPAIQAARVQSLRSAWQVTPDERIVLLVGRAAWKGPKVVVDAIRLLHDSGLKDLKLVVIGDGQGRSQGKRKAGSMRDLDQAIKSSGIAERIRKVEACADMPAALLAAAVVVMPSIEPEAFGRVAVEAQAVGTPVIVSDLGAVPETILAPPETDAAKRTGWRVSLSDPALLAVAMREALSLGASSRDALALRARQQVVARFAVDRMARETLDAYAALLERRATSA